MLQIDGMVCAGVSPVMTLRRSGVDTQLRRGTKKLGSVVDCIVVMIVLSIVHCFCLVAEQHTHPKVQNKG